MPRVPMSAEQFEGVRTRILAETAIIVGREGLSGLSMRTLARQLRLTPGALYRYFPAKQDLLTSLFENALLRLGERFAEIDHDGCSPVQSVRAMLMAYARFGLEDHDRFRLLFLENNDAVTREVFQRHMPLLPYDMLVGQVERAIESEIFDTIDIAGAAHMLWAGVHGAVTLVVTVDDIEFGPPVQFVTGTVDTLIRGLVRQENTVQ